MSEPNWERLGVRMLHKVCPEKDSHSEIIEHCPRCGISRSDFDRFVIGNEGKMEQCL